MNPGNLILHLPLEARNLAVTLESNFSLSHPTHSPLPSSIESSSKYLLYATPHQHHLCRGSDPEHLSCLHHHHWRFLRLFQLMPAALMLEGWFSTQKALQPSLFIITPKTIQVPLSFEQGLTSCSVRQHTKTFVVWPVTTFTAIFSAISSCPLLSKISFVSHTAEYLSYLNPCWPGIPVLLFVYLADSSKA